MKGIEQTRSRRVLQGVCIVLAIANAVSIGYVYARYWTRGEVPPISVVGILVPVVNLLNPADNRYRFVLKIVVCLITVVMMVFAVRIGARS